MANTLVASGNQEQQWAAKYYLEWNRDNQYAPYTGKSESSPIQLEETLMKKAGDNVTISLFTNLSGSGVTGDNTLRGNEEALPNYDYNIVVNQLRNAVRFGKMEQSRTAKSLYEVAKNRLKPWRMTKRRDDINSALYSPNIDGKTAYASTSESDKDIWVAANDDRIQFGAAISNNSSNDHSASLLNIDATNDVLTPAMIELAVRRMKQASPAIRPVMLQKDAREIYIMFCNSLAFRDLSSHATMTSANRDARTRGLDNPIFKGGDLWYGGVLIHEIPELDVISGVGAAGIDVAANFIVGAQAIGIGIGEKTHFEEERQDYNNLRGIASADIEGVDKLMFNDVQHGVYTLYTAGVADT